MLNEDGFTYEIKLQISAIDVLKKRADAIIPCNKTLFNEDQMWIKKAIKKMGCIPPFFRKYAIGNKNNLQNLDNYSCNQAQYQTYQTNYSPEFNFREIAEEYDPPCNQMTTIVMTTNRIVPTRIDRSRILNLSIASARRLPKIKIIVEYMTEVYRETTIQKHFGMLSLWSQIGGFVGIFLGFSLLQLPELLNFHFSKMK